MQRGLTKRRLLLAVLPTLLATGCGGTGDTGNGLFGGTGTSALGGASSPAQTAPAVASGVTSGSLTPNAAPLAPPSGTTSGATAASATPNGSLAPLSGTYTGTWAAVTTPPTSSTIAAPTATSPAPAVSVKSTPARGGAVTLKIAYPAHPSKTDLGDVSGTWTDAASDGTGKLSGSIDRIGLPSEPNAVHVVGKVQYPGGKITPLVVELSEDAVGHLAGATTADTISLKKSH